MTGLSKESEVAAWCRHCRAAKYLRVGPLWGCLVSLPVAMAVCQAFQGICFTEEQRQWEGVRLVWQMAVCQALYHKAKVILE